MGSHTTDSGWLARCSPAFRLMVTTSWLAPKAWRERQEQAMLTAAGAGIDWEEYLRLVARHRTPALSWAVLRRTPGVEIPEAVRKELQRSSDACQMQAVQHSLLLGEVLKGFERAEIAAMPMKGPILSLELYGEIGLRQARDLDLMVTPEDIPRAQTCLEAMGWCADAGHRSMTPRQWEACLRHDRHIGYVRTQALGGVELHWRTAWESSEQASERWARSTAATWRGHEHRAMDPVDKVLYLCGHGGDHAWFRMKWLGDMARLHASGDVDWVACLEASKRTGEERSVLLCLRLLQEAYGMSWPEGVAERGGFPVRLAAGAVRQIKNSTEPEPVRPLRRLGRRLWKIWYDGALWPVAGWGLRLAALAYSFEDYRVFPLPDVLFWAYIPLRPVLWVWRRLAGGSAVN